MSIRRVALLTAGGFAPCLSSAVGGLIERYTELMPEVEIIGYKYGYHGLLTKNYVEVGPEARANAYKLHEFGGSPLGNSRVKLTNVADLISRGLIEEGVDPLDFAAKRLVEDKVDVLHTIGGDDTNTTAADLAKHLEDEGYNLTVVGLPKTIDNDVIPIKQSLGADTAAEQGARFATNIIGEHKSSPRMLIVHEVMGRHCGWLTARTAYKYRQSLANRPWVPSLGYDIADADIDGIYLPEMPLDIDHEAKRLKKVMDQYSNVTIFLSEGAGLSEIVAEIEARGEEVERDPFGHVKLDTINPGQWFADQFAKKIGAEKVMVQKSGYFSRAAAANAYDLRLIKSMTDYAVECASKRISGVIGHDEENGNILSAIDFQRIAGGKEFDYRVDWFQETLRAIGQID